jgi:hypothetical protein
MTTRPRNDGPLDDTTPVSSANSPGTITRKSNDLPLGPEAPFSAPTRKSNNAPMRDSVAKINAGDGTPNDPPMVTQ